MSKISYFEDIVDELEKELNISRDELEELLKLNIEHIHETTKRPDVISIRLPKLGILHFNRKSAGFHEIRPFLEVFKKNVNSQKQLVRETKKNHKDLIHERRSYFTMIKKYFYPDRDKNIKATRQQVFKKLETKQNKL